MPAGRLRCRVSSATLSVEHAEPEWRATILHAAACELLLSVHSVAMPASSALLPAVLLPGALQRRSALVLLLLLPSFAPSLLPSAQQ